MPIRIEREHATARLNHMHIYNDNIHIGDYERAGDNVYDAKSAEVLNPELSALLLQLFNEHGKFVVRWNTNRKEVRLYRENQPDPGKNSQVRDTIPRRLWR